MLNPLPKVGSATKTIVLSSTCQNSLMANPVKVEELKWFQLFLQFFKLGQTKVGRSKEINYLKINKIYQGCQDSSELELSTWILYPFQY